MHYRSLLAAFVLLLPLHACTSDAEGDTDTDTDSGSTSGTTTGMPPTTMPPTTAGSSSTTSDDDESSSSESTTGPADSSSSGGADDSSSGGLGDEICVGFSLLGLSAEIYTDGPVAGGPVCSTKPAACQGDPVGEWTAQAACGFEVIPNFFEEFCEGSTQQITASNISGTRTFEKDGTYVFDTVTQLEADLQVDSMECLGLDCVAFGDALSKEPGLEMICEDGDGACNCFYTVDLPDMSAGTWDIFDDALLLTNDDGETLGLFQYCIADGVFTTWVPLYDSTEFPDTSCTENEDCEGQVEGEFDAIGCEPPEEKDR